MNRGFNRLTQWTSIAHRPRLSVGLRGWILRGLTVCVSLLPFLAAEMVLRTIEPPPKEAIDSDPWVDLHQVEPLFVKNTKTDRWEIPQSRFNFFCSDSFSANKTNKTRRIFVLGGSTVQGRPYATETAFSTWLRIKLEVSDPDTHFEVINCGGVSYASYRVAKILEEVLDHQPDAIILYTGHNEFLEDREYSDVRKLGWIRTKLVRVTRHIRLASWLQSILSPTNSPPSSTPGRLMPKEVSTRLDQPQGLARYQRDSKWRAGVERHFEATLQRMVTKTKASQVPLILCVPSSDLLRTPPFKTTPSQDLRPSKLNRFQTAWQQCKDPEQSQTTRLSAAQECLQSDPDHAGAHYLCGTMLYEDGDSETAIKHLIQARDQDVCPLRATSEIVATVRSAKHHPNVLLVDVPTIFDQQNAQSIHLPDGIPEPSWFLDHVHPTIKGHQMIADRCFEVMQALPWIQSSFDDKRYEIGLTEHLAGLDETYFARGKQRLEGLRRWTKGRASLPLSWGSPKE